ncbi:MAG: NAD-binding protein, partial [Saprospiraceae bacterium]|nr:NAD-binding protein [Saprospiraceae bacterium]
MDRSKSSPLQMCHFPLIPQIISIIKHPKGKLYISKMLGPRMNLYQYRGSLLSFRNAFLLLLMGTSVGIVGFMIVEGYNLREAIYMTIITLSTVGFQEVRPLSPSGQIFATLLILLNLGIFAYGISVVTGYIVRGELFKKFHLNMIESKIAKLDQHIIVCGYGRYGRQVVDHLLHHSIPFVLIERDEEKIQQIQSSEEKILYIEGDATNDENLLAAKIKSAKALISALPEDTDNLFTVISARQMNPSINIISRCATKRTERKLKQAGANHVIMPDSIGGFYMASLISSPGAVEFFSLISREFESDIGFEEMSYDSMPTQCQDQTIRQLKIRKNTGANIIGLREPSGHFIVNPEPDTMLVP